MRTSVPLCKWKAVKLATHPRIVASTGARGMADSKDCWLSRGDQHKCRQDWKRKQRQSASERIIKKVKGDDAERRLTEQRQRMANHRTRETGKQRYQQVISITGSLLSVNIFVFSCQTSNCRLLASHIVHVFPMRCARRTTCACAYSYTISYARPRSKITPSNYIFRNWWHSIIQEALGIIHQRLSYM